MSLRLKNIAEIQVKESESVKLNLCGFFRKVWLQHQ